MKTKTIYLDYAAATPVDKSVLAAMLPYFSDKFYNPSANYLAAHEVSEDLKLARQKVANILGARSSEIIFTSGGTEANNLAINGIMSQYPDANVVVSSTDHHSVLEPASKYDHRLVPVNQKGDIDMIALDKAIDDNTVLVSVMYANNEIGTISPVKDIARMIEAKLKQRKAGKTNKLPLLLHTDACQAGAYLDLHISRLGVDLMTLNGGKIYGPKQSGVLMVKTGVNLAAQILGGGQEASRRSGTENVAGCIGFGTALELVQNRRSLEVIRLTELRDLFIKKLTNTIDGCVINGSLSRRLPNNVHVTFPGVDNERLMMELDEVGILCAVGSACSASSDEPSHVLKAIGLSDAEAQSSLRFTMGIDTNNKDIDKLIGELKRLVHPK